VRQKDFQLFQRSKDSIPAQKDSRSSTLRRIGIGIIV
jgi:hypothetical protein